MSDLKRSPEPVEWKPTPAGRASGDPFWLRKHAERFGEDGAGIAIEMRAAADTIERLTAERDALREALKPFAEAASAFVHFIDAGVIADHRTSSLRVKDFRAAARALTPSTEP